MTTRRVARPHRAGMLVSAVLLLLTLATLTPAAVGGSQAEARTTTLAASWRLVGSDDFTTFNPRKWARFRGVPGCCPDALWDPSMVSVRGGALHLSNRPGPYGRWLSGGVGTWNWPAASRIYGRFDVRIRFAPGTGVSGAGLLWPKTNAWPPELDFFEIGAQYGSRQTMYITNHYLTPGASSVDAKHEMDQKFLSGSYSSWHTVSTRWSPNSMTVYVDGVLRFSETDPAKIPDVNMWLGLQTHVEKVNGVLPKLPPGKSSIDLDVDWVRVYERV